MLGKVQEKVGTSTQPNMIIMIHGARPMAENDSESAVRAGAAPQEVFMPVETAPSAYIPLSDSLMDKHQGAGGKHIRNLAHKNQEHGQLVHNQSSQNTDKN